MFKQSTTLSQRMLARQLFHMTWPMIFGVLSMMSFQLVDSIFISQLGVLPLAAQGFTMPMQMVLIGLQVGFGIAITAVIAQALGRSDTKRAKQLGGLILILGSLSVALFALLIYLMRDMILSLLSAPVHIFPIIDQYWPVWLFSAWFGASNYFLYSICRANGNTLLPGAMMVVTSLINIVLDPIFIFSLDLGLRGAAIATSCAFSVGALVVSMKIWPRHWISFHWSGLPIRKNIRAILQVMGPASISQLLPSISSMTATKILASFGPVPVAAWAIGSRFEFFSMVTVFALTMAMPPMVARLFGEKKITEIRYLVRAAVLFTLIFQTLLAVISFGLAEAAATLMSHDPSVQQLLTWHLTYVPVSLGPLGICMLMVSISNALSRSYTALFISALRLFVFFLPCLWIGIQVAQLQGIYIGVLVGNLLAGSVAWLIYYQMIQRLDHLEHQPKDLNDLSLRSK